MVQNEILFIYTQAIRDHQIRLPDLGWPLICHSTWRTQGSVWAKFQPDLVSYIIYILVYFPTKYISGVQSEIHAKLEGGAALDLG